MEKTFDDFIEMLRKPEELEEGIIALKELFDEKEKAIDDLRISNDRYKETNANLAMRIGFPQAEKNDDVDEAEKIFDTYIKEMNA